MAHFEKAATANGRNALFSTSVAHRKQVWRMSIPKGQRADILLAYASGFKLESPGGLLNFSEGKPVGSKRLITITADAHGAFELLAVDGKGRTQAILKVYVDSGIEAKLRSQAITVLSNKAINKMSFQIGNIQLAPIKVRKVKKLLSSGELTILYNPSLSVGAFLRKQDQMIFPYATIATLEQKANACHELVHAAMDHHYPGHRVKYSVSEAVGYIAQLIFLRVEKPSLTLKNVQNNPIAREAFKAAGQVLAGKGVSLSQEYRLRNTIMAHPLYKDKKNKSMVYDGI